MVSIKTRRSSVSYSVALYIVCRDGLTCQRTWQGVQEMLECVEAVYRNARKASYFLFLQIIPLRFTDGRQWSHTYQFRFM